MNKKLIIPMIIFLVLFIVVILILIIYKSKRKSKLKKEIEKLDIEKNKIIDVNILSELAKVRNLVKTDDLKRKLNDWDNILKDIKDNQINILTDSITDADFLIDKKDFNGAVKKIADIEIMLNSLKEKTENLLEEVKVITNSEERNRSIITKLKTIYRELENKYERTSKDYEFIKDSVDSKFKYIDKMFKDFEALMEKNDYVSVEKLVVNLEDEINKFKVYIDTTPDMLLIANVLIPNKIEETKLMYSRMQRDGYQLDYLNIEYNIKEIENKVKSILEGLKDYIIENASIELKTMLEYFNTIYSSFDKEKDAKDSFKEELKKLKKKIEEVNKVVYGVYVQLDDIKNTYDLNDEDINKFDDISHELENINNDYKSLYEHGKGKTFAYTKLMDELMGLSNRVYRLQDELDYHLKSITSMKDDESRAKEQLNMIQNLLLQSKSKLKEYKIPVIPNTYYVELKEAGDAIREIIKELDKKPITIATLNIRVDTARDLVFKIYNRTNDLVKDVISVENLIVYGNRYRSTNPVIDNVLEEASQLFMNGSYKHAMDKLVNTLSKVDSSVGTRFVISNDK